MTPVSPTIDMSEEHQEEQVSGEESVPGKEEAGEMLEGGDVGIEDTNVRCDEGNGLVCMPCEDSENIDQEVDIEAEVQRAARDPGQPTRAEREEHNLTHFPLRSWCRACVLGRARDAPSSKVKGLFAETVLPRVRMDYCFLTESVEKEEGEHGEKDVSRAETTITVAVMQESLCRSVWSYAVETKGSMEEWMVQQVCDDLETVGLKNERLVLKSDQEPAIVDVMKEIQKARECEYGTSLDNSRVGDSDSNGTIENAVSSVQGVARTLKIALEERIGQRIQASDPIIPWLIRHSGHLITRSWIRPNGKTAYQMIKGRRSNAQLKELGEAVWFRIPETKSMPGKLEPKWEEGVYVGFVIRTGEDLVWTPNGVFRVSTVRRRPADERWSKQLLDGIVGTPATPVPGVAGRKVPTYAKKFSTKDPEKKPSDFMPPEETEAPRARTWKILKEDIIGKDGIGPTPGCPGCRALERGVSWKAGHTPECRLRVERHLTTTEEGRARLARADERLAHETLRQQGINPYASGTATDEGGGDDAAEKPPTSDAEMDDEELARKLDKKHGTQSTATSSIPPATRAATEDRMKQLRANAEVSQSSTSCKRPGPGEDGDESRGDDAGRGDPQDAPGRPAPSTQPAPSPPSNAATSSSSAAPPPPAPPASSRTAKRKGEVSTEGRRVQTERRGEKRPTEESVHPEDPRGNDTESPDVSMVQSFSNRCGCCKEAFESKNLMYEHIRQNRHAVVSDEEDQEVDSVQKKSGKNWTPGTQVSSKYIRPKDLEWRDIGSGIVAKTFKGVTRLWTTTKRGPALEDVKSRRIWSLSKGIIIDECDIHDTTDARLNRSLPEPDDIRVELTLKGAQELYMRDRPDVAEIYSNPRVCQEANARRYDGKLLKPGWSLDLSTKDPSTGRPWDLSVKATQAKVKKMIIETEPYCIVGSPPCTAFSQLQGLNKAKRDPNVVRKEFRKAREHIRFCLEVYSLQMKAGRHFVHEHPWGSSAWKLPEMLQFILEFGVESVKTNMCSFGMMSRDENGPGLVSKPTRIMSSAVEVLKKIEKPCRGGHRHVHLVAGKAKAAQVYPKKFCTTLCAGIAAQKKLDDLGMVARPLMSVDEMREVAKSAPGEDPSDALHEECGNGIKAYDDLTGDELDPTMMKKARKEEIAYFKKMGVYDKVDIEECYKVTGKAPIAVRWVDVNKGDSTNPNYRSRLVAKEFNTGVNHDLYAATPPSECLRLLLSILANKRQQGTTLMYADVSRAYFYAKAERPVFVKLPEEDREEGDGNKCGRLRMSMYGTRDAALNWSKEYAGTLAKAGFTQGRSNPCLFRNEDMDVSIMVHGDDFVAVGSEENLKTTRAVLEEKYKIKVEVLGDGEGQSRELRILNKVVRITEEGIELEADPRHVELTIRDLGLQAAKTSAVPGAKDLKPRGSSKKEADEDEEICTVDRRGRGGEWKDSEIEAAEGGSGGLRGEQEEVSDSDDPLLNGAQATLYRAVAARLNYLSPDRPDIAYSVKEAARAMSAPRESHMTKIKKLGRYLKGKPRLICKFRWQDEPDTLTTFTDSDWAGCKSTAKSTSGGIICLGEHTIKTYSKQQKIVALSSAEAELYGMVAASAESMGIQAYAADLGLRLKCELYTDSSAALGIAKRAGIGKVRHLRTQGLWIQETRISGRITYKKVLGEKNPSDLLTKYMTADLSRRHLETIHAEFAEGRAETAPEIGSADIDESDDEEEDLKSGDIDGGVISWVRKFIERGEQKVKFHETVNVRPVPAVGLGRSCRGTSSMSRRGRWPGSEDKAAKTKAAKDVIDTIEEKKDEEQVDMTGETKRTLMEDGIKDIDPRSTERTRGEDQAAGSHEPCGPNLSVREVVKTRRWADMDSSDSEDESLHRPVARDVREETVSSSEGNGDEDTRQISYLGIDGGESCRRRRSKSEDAPDFDFVYAEPQAQRDANFVFTGHCTVSQSLGRSRSGYKISRGVRLHEQWFDRPTQPATRGSASPTEHCVDVYNLQATSCIGPSAERASEVDGMHFACVEGGASGFLSLSRTMQRVCMHVQEHMRMHCHASIRICVIQESSDVNPLRGLKSASAKAHCT